ncbi:unnamed protein product [Miscanthus lutarioriparius]|uniref:Plant heme peroxidase family profile domain-containing protein n=1 Tax=Miscanthus lutarioriparius TaxID=422564 RepID=A0A811SPA4_9POAL|nr:unnamed protein product [Miscanthus lutarioriparius]
MSTNVDGKLPPPSFNLDQLTSMFAVNNLSQADAIALSGEQINQITTPQRTCGGVRALQHVLGPDPAAVGGPDDERDVRSGPAGGVPGQGGPQHRAAAGFPVTPQAFDNQYFVNLVNGRGLLTSDQVLYSDARSQPTTVVAWAQNATDFEQAFVDAIARLAASASRPTRRRGTSAATAPSSTDRLVWVRRL